MAAANSKRQNENEIHQIEEDRHEKNNVSYQEHNTGNIMGWEGGDRINCIAKSSVEGGTN